MSDLPPPYPEYQDTSFGPVRYVGRIQSTVTIPSQTTVHSPFDDYSHRHDVYLSAVAPQDQLLGPTFKQSGKDRLINTLHFWTPDHSLSAFVPFSNDIEPDLLSKVQGFQDYGCFGFNVEANYGNSNEHTRQLVHEQLAGMEITQHQRDKSATQPSSTGSKQASSAHSTDLKQAVDPKVGHSPVVHIYKIHMFSKDATFIEPASGEAIQLVFKWAKPPSTYGSLRGSWEVDLINVVKDGTLRAGGDLMLLVRGASDQQMEYLQAEWEEGTHILEF